MTDVKFIAEVSSNHNRDLGRALAFVDAAADIGCDAVKFQLFKLEELFAPEILSRSATHRARKNWELPLDFLAPLSERCHTKGIEFACTPFYLGAVEELLPYVDFYKIASYELLWNDLLDACMATGKPLILSTGMSTSAEVLGVLRHLRSQSNRDLGILRCTSAYPTPVIEANLNSIATLQEITRPFMDDFDLTYGWSDHTTSPGVLLRAIFEFGARIVEFHLDLEGEGEEFKSQHCWLPQEIAPVIQATRDGFKAGGSGDLSPTPSELSDRDWRADPRDGLRPMRSLRKGFHG